MSFLMKRLAVPSKVCAGGPYLKPTSHDERPPGTKQVQLKQTANTPVIHNAARLALGKNPGKYPHLGSGWDVGTTTVPFNCTSRNVASETQMFINTAGN